MVCSSSPTRYLIMSAVKVAYVCKFRHPFFIQIVYFHWTLRNSLSCCLKLFWITSLIGIRKSSKPSCKLTCPAFNSLWCPLITLNSKHRHIISNMGRPSYDAGDTSVASHCMRLTELVKSSFLGWKEMQQYPCTLILLCGIATTELVDSFFAQVFQSTTNGSGVWYDVSNSNLRCFLF